MKRHSAFLKLFLGNLLVMVVIAAIGGAVAYQRLDASYQQQARDDQDRLARCALRHFQALWPLDQASIDRICKDLFRDPSVRLTLIAPDGRVLGESSQDPLTMVNHKTDDRPEVLAALGGNPGIDERRSGTRGVQYRYAALPLVRDGAVAAVVRLAVPMQAFADGESLLRHTLLWSAMAGIVVAAMLGLLVSWIWYAPLRRVSLAARQIASGDLARKVRAAGGGELAELASSLDAMRESLRRQFAQITAQGQDLQTVLTTMREGVIATDAHGQVVLMNSAAGSLLSADPRQAAGKSLQMVAPILELLNFHNRLMGLAGGGKTASAQFEMQAGSGRRILDVQGAVSTGPSSIRCVLVLRDVTELTATAAMKTQFVANASHELRTPLATIRAAVDSLASVEPGDHEEVAKLAAMLDRHVERLQNMTNDLLDLHMVESGKLPLRLQDISLGDLVEWARTQFAAHAQEKGLALAVTASRPECRLRSDRKLLELILRNLIDNAIKFTPSSGRVECLFDVADKGVYVRVKDTGCGIKPEDQPRVFERFYQSDASRSGDTKTRGTGLGLAIVKHAAERLGAKIELESALGRGTTVTVWFVGATA